MALFSKRHYEAIAAALRKEIELAERDSNHQQEMNDDVASYHAGALDSLSNVRQCLADLFYHDNPAFNRDRFLKASGTKECTTTTNP